MASRARLARERSVERPIALAAIWMVLAAVLPPGAAVAADRTRPRIVRAQMVDSNRNDRADRVVLTYSEKINHPVDKDGRYPFKVGDYKIKKVSAAKRSKKLVILLKEKARKDINARPVITYRPTRQEPVRDLRRNQAVKQRFRKVVRLDRDGDGYAAKDCAPGNASIHPGADDTPDLSRRDSNCDGMDGDPDAAVFVAPSGNDGDPGTRAQPKATVAAAVAAAELAGKDVYAATGHYNEGTGIELADGVGIYGGFSTSGTSRSGDPSRTTITGTPIAAVASGDTGVTLQLLSLDAQESVAAGSSVYGLLATGGSVARLEGVRISTADAVDGADGVTPGGVATAGANGGPGGAGVEDSSGVCSGGTRPSGGSAGGSVVSSASGGVGGRPGHESGPGDVGGASPGGTPGGPGTPAGAGDWDTPSTHWGVTGAAGGPGLAGGPGAAAFGPSGYVPPNGQNGGTGAFGRGGGGGGGGGGGDDDCNSYGGAGGGGGAGGAGGSGGGGGQSGGGSFGIYLDHSEVTMIASSISAGAGGHGGSGADGQPGGAGGKGGRCGGPSAVTGKGNCYGGGGEQDDGSNGGRGGDGGPGGIGGPGGGGAGGPSFGVFVGTLSAFVRSSTTIAVGFGGHGGESLGIDGPFGQAAETFNLP